ncbi:MAG: MucB/RseB C-terminal domain-containing protein [Woeseiaceae bacterium]
MKRLASALLVSCALACSAAFASDQAPGDWLQKMADAVQTTNYDGTVIRIQNGNAEALKVVHLVSDGVIREKVIVQEGSGMEIIRNGNEVHCILPDRKSVLVEEWDDQSTLFSTLPSSDIRFGSEYDVSIVREDRVAGRKAIVLAIRPHDDFRYGHRLWLDQTTGFPLQTKLMATDGTPIEQVKFADIRLGHDIHDEQLEPSIDIENFRWFLQPKTIRKTEMESGWVSEELPPGFQITASHFEQSEGEDEAIIHMMISDGLANVSVFIEPNDHGVKPRSARAGAANSFSLPNGDYLVTAVGEVPPATAEHIARSMQQK